MIFYGVIVTDEEGGYLNNLCTLNINKCLKRSGYLVKDKSVALQYIKSYGKLFPQAKFTLIEAKD